MVHVLPSNYCSCCTTQRIPHLLLFQPLASAGLHPTCCSGKHTDAHTHNQLLASAAEVLQVSKIFSDVDVSTLASGQGNEADELTPEEFAEMRREVELLGKST